MRLIDADALLNKRTQAKNYQNDMFVIGQGYVMDAPTIEIGINNFDSDGYWFFVEYEYFNCSNCGEGYFNGADSTEQAKNYLEKGRAYNFCPYCGIKMNCQKEK